jgi:anthranilate phosphoribosyltransferase
MGVYSRDWVVPLAEVLKRLGSEHVLVVSSEDGMDEISISAPTLVAELKDGAVKSYTIQPEDFGMQRAALATIRAADAQDSLHIIKGVLANQPGAARDIVCLNAGAAIYVAGVTDSLAAGVQRAAEVIAEGRAAEKLQQLVAKTTTRL